MVRDHPDTTVADLGEGLVRIVAKPLMYFLCTANSCRSQMAEGFARHMAGDRVEVASAGLEPSSLNAQAVMVMGEVGIDISGHTSKAIDADLLQRADVIVTLCGDANDRCPSVPASARRLHWDLPDPARAAGTEAERMAVFRSVRDKIRRHVAALVSAGLAT